MTESEFPRKTNLNERKRSVLKIAKENFHFVKRLQNARSGGYAAENPSGRCTPLSQKRPNSGLQLAYPNVIDADKLFANSKTRNNQRTHSRTQRTPKINFRYAQNILGIGMHAQSASANTFVEYAQQQIASVSPQA